MLFPTVTFATFFLLVFVASWVLMPRFRLWKWFMIAASCVFYGWWNVRFVLLLGLLWLGNLLLADLVSRARSDGARRAWLATALVFDIGILGWFKYYGFFVSSAANLLADLGFAVNPPLLELLLPVGLSFVTFRVLSYVIDVYRGTLATASALDFALYVAFFPYLLAGPIARAAEFLPQLNEPRDRRRIDASRAFFLIIAGLFKKMVVADYLATHIVNGVFATPAEYSGVETLVGIYGYAVQIYCDFSAYSDIAIGTALLLGFELPDNFHAPYTAVTLREFWRRWHITLSRWLRDYLYIPLGGNRISPGRTYVNIMVTMVLGGLWHGAAWTFVVWGTLHGAGLTAERYLAERREEDEEAAGARDAWWRPLARRLLVFNFVSFAWVFFRAESLGAAGDVLARLFTGGLGPNPAVTSAVVLLITLGVAIQFVPSRLTLRLQATFSRATPLVQGVALAGGLFVVDVLGPPGVASFLYFTF